MLVRMVMGQCRGAAREVHSHHTVLRVYIRVQFGYICAYGVSVHRDRCSRASSAMPTRQKQASSIRHKVKYTTKQYGTGAHNFCTTAPSGGGHAPTGSNPQRHLVCFVSGFFLYCYTNVRTSTEGKRCESPSLKTVPAKAYSLYLGREVGTSCVQQNIL